MQTDMKDNIKEISNIELALMNVQFQSFNVQIFQSLERQSVMVIICCVINSISKKNNIKLVSYFEIINFGNTVYFFRLKLYSCRIF